MFKFLFDILIDPFGLPIEWYWEYLILAIIGAVAYGVAYRFVGDMYHIGAIDSRMSGSFLHWLIRFIFFAVLWAFTYGVIVTVRGLTLNWLLVLYIAGGIIVMSGIVTAIILFIRKQKNFKMEVTADA